MTAEYKNQLEMGYSQLAEYLQSKYGKPISNYFLTESCKSPNSKIKRTKEGLYIHHIAEYHKDYDMIDNLSNTDKAIQYPYEFQTPNWLCYCNCIEHIILHYKIYQLRVGDNDVVLDDGLVHYLLPELKEWYKTKGANIKGTWRESAYNVVKDNERDFIEIYNRFYKEFPKAPKYSYGEYVRAQQNHKIQRPNYF